MCYYDFENNFRNFKKGMVVMAQKKEKKSKQKKRKLKPWIRNILLILLLLLFLFATYKIIRFYVDLHQNKKENEQLIEEVYKVENVNDEESITIDFSKLLTINKDVKGWIQYNDAIINYPIVQSKDNDYYLKKNIYKKYNQAGSIFMDYRNKGWDDQNVVLFGHNMSDQSMFGSLNAIIDNEDYFNQDEHHYIKIWNTNNELFTYQIFSIYTIEKEDYYITTSFSSKNSFQKFIDTMKKRSKKSFDVEVTTKDKILTLSTCMGSGGTSKREVIHAKRVEL